MGWEGLRPLANTNEPSGSTEDEEFLAELLEYWLLKKDPVSWSSVSA
jgi:hypothetical protein